MEETEQRNFIKYLQNYIFYLSMLEAFNVKKKMSRIKSDSYYLVFSLNIYFENSFFFKKKLKKESKMCALFFLIDSCNLKSKFNLKKFKILVFIFLLYLLSFQFSLFFKKLLCISLFATHSSTLIRLSSFTTLN